jgi:hypothetical protein
MLSAGLISEGITDQAILENILIGVFGDDNIDVNPLRPLRDQTDTNRVSQGQFSNWELVFDFCRSTSLGDALEFNDILVIHIDTDCGAEVNFGLALTSPSGDLRSVAELVADTRALLINAIGTELYDTYAHRIVFAIPVLSSECWILAIANVKGRASVFHNCDDKVFHRERRAGNRPEKTYKYYDQLSALYRKSKHLTRAAESNESLQCFLTELAKVIPRNGGQE